MWARSIRVSLLATVLLSAVAAPHARATDTAAFDAFGGKPGLEKVADLGIDNVLADPRIKAKFANANIPHLKAMLAMQFCALLNGPCEYTGLNMKDAHAGMNLRDADFNALAEDFQVAMNTAGVPFRYQNMLLSKLAPMERDITTR